MIPKKLYVRCGIFHEFRNNLLIGELKLETSDVRRMINMEMTVRMLAADVGLPDDIPVKKKSDFVSSEAMSEKPALI